MKQRFYVCLVVVCLFVAGAFITRTVHPSMPSQESLKVAARMLPSESRAVVAENYGRLPLNFEANCGQTDAQVEFLSHGKGFMLFLKRGGEAVLALREAAPQTSTFQGGARPLVSKGNLEAPQPVKVVRMRLAGASSAAPIEGVEESPGKANYFIGNDPRKWRPNVRMFAKVKYRNVYPGVDLVYHGHQGRLEDDFIVAPGADPHSIVLQFTGMEKVSLDEHGGLVLKVKDGEVHLEKPYIYQEIAGTRHEIAGGYVVEPNNEAGFQIAAYNETKPLVIDPTVAYSTYLGGSNMEAAEGIAVDSAGNAYLTGSTVSPDFPTTPGAYQTTNPGNPTNGAVFVTKLNRAGTALVYSTYLGGSAGYYGFADNSWFDPSGGIAVDSSGSAFVTGATNSTTFPTTPGAFQRVNKASPGSTAFVTKLNPEGSGLVYSTYLGGSGGDEAYGITLDRSTDVFVVGTTSSTDFPTTPGAFRRANPNGGSVFGTGFVSKLNPRGTGLIYSTFLGGSSRDGDLVAAVAVNGTGSAYVTGFATSTNFPTTPGAFQTTNHGYGSAFVSKLNFSGSALAYSTFLGGNNGASGAAIAVDNQGHAYVTGSTQSTDFPTTSGAFQRSYRGDPNTFVNAFVTKLNREGSALVYSTYLGGGYDFGSGIALNTARAAYITGFTSSPNFPTTADAFQSSFNALPFCGPTAPGFGCRDAFVTVLGPAGNTLVYSTYLGGSQSDYGTGIATDNVGNAYVTGGAQSPDFPTTPGAFQTTKKSANCPYSNCSNAFVAKLAGLAPPHLTGSARGKGTVDVGGRIAQFRFDVKRMTENSPIRGYLTYHDHARDAKIVAETITAFSVSRNTASFGGTCTADGTPCRFSVSVADDDQAGGRDLFAISVNGKSAEGGEVRTGRIEVESH